MQWMRVLTMPQDYHGRRAAPIGPHVFAQDYFPPPPRGFHGRSFGADFGFGKGPESYCFLGPWSWLRG
jgi:hypothetical protein